MIMGVPPSFSLYHYNQPINLLRPREILFLKEKEIPGLGGASRL